MVILMNDLLLRSAEVPLVLWFIERSVPIIRAETFMANPEGYIKELKVIKKTPSGWRGICVTYDRNSKYERSFLEKNYLFFKSKEAALNHLLVIARKRHERLNEVASKCGDLVSRLEGLLNEQN